MTSVAQLGAVATTPALVQLLVVRKAVDGVRGSGELPIVIGPSRTSPASPPAVQRIARLGSMLDRYL